MDEARPAPVLRWSETSQGQINKIICTLETLLIALDEHPLQILKGGRAFRFMLDYDEDRDRPVWGLKSKGWFILRGGSTMLRIDLRPAGLGSDRPSPVRIDEPCQPGARVQPNAESIASRVRGLLDAIAAPKPDPRMRRDRMDEATAILTAAYASCAGDGGRDGAFVRFPGPWESFPYISSILREDRLAEPPHFMFENTRTGTVHPDLIAMLVSLPGPHGYLHVDEQTHRIGSPSIHCTIRPDTSITIPAPATLDPLATMRTLARWNPSDGKPPLQP